MSTVHIKVYPDVGETYDVYFIVNDTDDIDKMEEEILDWVTDNLINATKYDILSCTPYESHYGDIPTVGENVVFCGTVCYVKAVDKRSGVLTVEVANPSGSYISYVHATDVDRFLLD